MDLLNLAAGVKFVITGGVLLAAVLVDAFAKRARDGVRAWARRIVTTWFAATFARRTVRPSGQANDERLHPRGRPRPKCTRGSSDER